MTTVETRASARRSDGASAVVVAVHLAFTYAPVYLAAISKPGPLLVVFWLWFGLCNNGLINLMHECAHRLAFKRAWANDLVGGTLLASMVVTNFATYRQRHWEHHRELGTERDPKLVYRTNVRGGAIVALLFRSLVGIEAFRRMTERPADVSANAGVKHATITPRLVAVQAVFASSLLFASFSSHRDASSVVVAAGLAYGFVYAYGLGSLTVFAAAFRAIAEHGLNDEPCRREGRAALRNLRCNALTRLLLGAYGFGEHATHHLHPGIPYYALAALTTELARDDPSLVSGRGYIGTVVRLVAPPGAHVLAPSDP